jgi:23S rRNA (adenine1618-N6)-methyltransferase
MPQATPSQRDYYAQDVDFDDLASRDPEWAAICEAAKESNQLNFRDPKIVL